jgi:hypothetical protein
LDSYGSEQEPLAVPSEHINEPSSYIKKTYIFILVKLLQNQVLHVAYLKTGKIAKSPHPSLYRFKAE